MKKKNSQLNHNNYLLLLLTQLGANIFFKPNFVILKCKTCLNQFSKNITGLIKSYELL